MKPASSPSLTYFPAYLGLFAALTLAAACNAFLDIQYGSFGMEMLLWTTVFGLTLRLGWRQHGRISDAGQRGQKIMLVLGMFLTVLIFIPMWGFPRAGLAMLAILQAAQNCVTVTRRQLHFGLLVSAVMVMFAASHYRADWTMLFYLVPYVTAAVFTLVAEQISRRAQDQASHSLAPTMVGGQGAAIAAATAVILLLGLLLYVVTPQPMLPYAQWKYGVLGNLGHAGKNPPIELGNQPGGSQTGGGAGAGGQGQEAGGGESAARGGFSENSWPTPAEMREAARRPGMPQWQRSVITAMADAEERLMKKLQPILQQLEDWWQAFKEWLHQHLGSILRVILWLGLLAVLYALWRLMREARTVVWLISRLEYLRIGILGRHAVGATGARQIYRAMERLFELRDTERPPQSNAREYLHELDGFFSHLRPETDEMTRLFENYRYGRVMESDPQVKRMRDLYVRIYQRIGNPTSAALASRTQAACSCHDAACCSLLKPD